MKVTTPPVRFLGLVAALWIGARVLWLLPESAREDIILPTQALATVPSPDRHSRASGPAGAVRAARDTGGPEQNPTPYASVMAAALSSSGESGDVEDTSPEMPAVSMPLALDIPAPSPAIEPGRHPDSRWSGNFYFFTRDGGSDALAAGGQLGGGQAGARVAWRLNRNGPTRYALAARIYMPLDDAKGAEAAAGVDIHPLPGQPLRLSIERRFDVGGRGRNAWSAYGAGGFWRDLGGGIEADGYAQAGVVGGEAADFFADGSVRLVGRRDIAPATALRLGGGIWGGAQPGVERLDIGPRAAISLPVAGTMMTAAIEGRIRVAGDADPGSGVALTLASDF